MFGIVLDYYTTVEQVAGEQVSKTNYTPVFLIGAGMFLFAAACWFLIDCTKRIDD